MLRQGQQEHKQEESPEMQALKSKLTSKPFWIFFSEKHREQNNPRNLNTGGYCCFNHIIGLPKKNGIEHQLYDYEKLTL
jgi:hypothetical protein